MISKKFTCIALSLCLTLTAGVLSGCGKEDNTQPTDEITKKVSDKVTAYTTDLDDSRESLTTNKAISDYLITWAKAKNLNYKKDAAGNILVTKSADKDYKNVPPTVLICPYEGSQFQNYVKPLAMSLYITKNVKQSGKTTIVFTPKEGNAYPALAKISKKVITDDARVITLSAAEQGLFSTNSGASGTYRFTQSAKTTSPKLAVAYRISISGIPTGQPDSKIRDHSNPITEVSSYLTSMRNRNILFELASFQGGINSTQYASSASMTIVVDSNNEEKLKDRLDSSIESWKKKYEKEYPNATYTYKKVSVPSHVYTKSTTNKLMSFMYTLLNGVYYRDDDGKILAICNISKVDATANKKITYDSVAYSLDEGKMKEIDTGEQTLANLSEIKFKKTSSLPLWKGDAESDFAKQIKAAYDEVTGKKLTYKDSVAATCATTVQQLNDKASIVNITVNDNIVQDCTATFERFAADSNNVEE